MKFSQDIPIKADYDVVVCGAGPAGCAAALSAAREGLSVLLVESTSQLGGMAVTGHVSHWLGGRTQEGEWVVGGLFRQMATETAGKGYSVLPHLQDVLQYRQKPLGRKTHCRRYLPHRHPSSSWKYPRICSLSSLEAVEAVLISQVSRLAF